MASRYNFDEPVERRGTSCAKYDMAARRGKDPDLLPLWVADMDFRAPDEAVRALQERAAHGVFGYTDISDEYCEAVQAWFGARHGWRPDRSWFVVTPGVVFALAAAVNAFTDPGDAVLIQPPVYYPFRSTIRNNGRKLVCAPLAFDEAAMPDANPYVIDFDAFERAIVESNAKLFILCNPHNPVGRVWREDELRRLGEICLAHDVLVVSDEIHADFARPGFTHTVFASLGERIAQRCVVCTAASKTFNLAGLQTSNIFIPNPELRKRFSDAVEATGYDNINVMGMVATQACYEHGADWLAELKDYVEGNLAFMNDFVRRELPQLRVVQPESTYLVWVDCRGLGLSHDELRALVERDAKLWLDHGAMFGPEGAGFMRFNIATQRAVLEQALVQLRDAVSAAK